jgi:hypothetical protein
MFQNVKHTFSWDYEFGAGTRQPSKRYHMIKIKYHNRILL